MPSDIRCPNCGNEIPPSCRFCPYCSIRLCTNCHKTVPQGANHCPWCNFLLIGTGGTQMSQPYPPTPPSTPKWSPPPPQQTPFPGSSPWSHPPSPQPPLPQEQPTIPPETGYHTPGGIIIGRQPTPQQESPPPSTSIYPHEQTERLADKIPTPITSDPSIPHDAYGYDAAGRATPAHYQPQYRGKQETLSQESQTWAQAGIKDIKGRSPSWIVIIIVILAVGLIGFAIYNFGLYQSPFNSIKELISKTSSIPFLSSMFGGSTSEDDTPPTISNVLITDVTSTGAVITWITDEPATSQVMFCEPDGLCCWTEADKNQITDHSVTMTELKPNIKYHYTISSLDASENEAIAEGELTTAGEGSTTTTPAGPLLISSIKVTDIEETSATINWKTSIAATGQVEYGKTDAYGLAAPASQQPATEHSLTLTNLEPSTTYHFKFRLSDAGGNEVSSEIDHTFTTSALPPGISEGIERGMRAPNFTLQDLDGKNINLTDYRGKLVMINFWGGGYPRSRNEMPVIQTAYDTWSTKGLVVLGVNYKETPTQVQDFVDEKNITYTILLDPTAKVHEQYGAPSIPTTFFLDKSGIIREVRYSAISNAAAIEATLESMQ